MKTRPSMKIELTPEQLKLAEQATRRKGSAQDLTPEALEERIAPTSNLNLSKDNR